MYDKNASPVLNRYFLILFGLCFVNIAQVWASTYEEGRSAYILGNYREAYNILKPLADDGDSEAQKILGIMYDYGHGVDKDPIKALEWYIQSAEQGHPAVQYQVGAKYFRGDGVTQDYNEAAKWWELAANGGQVDAQFNLGLMYYRGLTKKRNDVRAAELFQLASEQEHGYAQYSLAVMYSFGHGVDKDYKTALKWFRTSAEKGVAQAQYNMGVYYENGYGVDKDLEMARKWYERATAQGLDEAKEKLSALDISTSEAVTAEYSIDEILPAGIRREDWVLLQQPDTYTLQIGSVTTEKDIINFIKENHLESGAAYISVKIDGVTRYNAFYGVFNNYDEANLAIEELPTTVRNIKPWVRNFGILQSMLNKDH